MHEVFTVAYLGWSALENGELLSRAASNGFDVVLSQDQGIEYEQNLTKLPLAVLLLRGKTIVMTMLIAWQVLNKNAYPQDERYSKSVLVIAPGLTVKSRLGVLA